MTPVPAVPSTGRRVRWPSVVGIDLAAFAVFAVVSLLAGLLFNGLHRRPLPLWYRSREERLYAAVVGLAPLRQGARKPGEIGLDDFQSLALAHQGVVIDARGSFFYGEGHVPGALNISREGFRTDYQRLESRLRAHRTDVVAVYCSGADCHDADLVANALASLGYEKLLVYREGWEEWSQSGLPQEK